MKNSSLGILLRTCFSKLINDFHVNFNQRLNIFVTTQCFCTVIRMLTICPTAVFVLGVFAGKGLLSSTPIRFLPPCSSGRLKPSELRSRKRNSMFVCFVRWFNWASDVMLCHICIHDVSCLQSLFRQQLKILQQTRVVQNQKLKKVRELYEMFVKVISSIFLMTGVIMWYY